MRTTMILAAVVLVLVLVMIALEWRRGGAHRDTFFGGQALGLSWAPPAYQFPSRLVYDWAVCSPDPAVGPTSQLSCVSGQSCLSTGKAVDPTDPATWCYGGGGLTAPKVSLDATSCPPCMGYALKFAVRARDPTATPPVASPWTVATIDLSGKSRATISLLDASRLPLVAGSSAFVYSLAVDPPVAPGSAAADILLTLYRPGSGYFYQFADLEPLAISDSGVWEFSGSFSDASLWLRIPNAGNQGSNAVPPGPLLAGDSVAATARVIVPGPNGTVAYWGTYSVNGIATAGIQAPSAIAWSLK